MKRWSPIVAAAFVVALGLPTRRGIEAAAQGGSNWGRSWTSLFERRDFR